MGNKRIDAVTEAVPVLAPDLRPAVDAAIAAHRHRAGALLPILHAVQQFLGWIPEGAVAPIAQALNLSRADVHGTISFYHDFRRTPPGRHVVRVCAAEACQAMGARALHDHAERRLGIRGHGTSRDGRFTLEPIYCLGNCALSPALLFDGELHGRMTPARFDALVSDCRAADDVEAA